MITITFIECEEALSKLADMPMYESDTGKEDLLSELKSVCQLYKQMLQDAVISEIRKIFDVLHFLEILEMSWIFQTFIETYNNVFPASIASAERSFSRQIKRYTRCHTLNNG